jgi:hypothetical protein
MLLEQALARLTHGQIPLHEIVAAHGVLAQPRVAG